ncbi:pre-mRNA-splicing factor of RES complex protein [Gregarina niphandrodes]|uniref:Pre-mRNA-splicing factor of RES complex protein n=1 Tax=Gregarina niphandrodes TaxID=110365 RepID=A0A023B6E8_GRENI|nr:pre-mRNA-splicing factor of RES complex protein [Gregarina niphandrodes]EZG66410.1 pre-mRNA-splicing factor of RES complex protein [Gregarina niphandrodes]|eukprot:XP_011134002.1 pre-mRNA-splicing factor of RES complex protein [Gregarina niphandrodes]
MIRITDDEDIVFEENPSLSVPSKVHTSQPNKVKKDLTTKESVNLPGVVYRSKTGHKITRQEYLKERGLNENFEKSRRQSKKNVIHEKDLEWGGGLVQKREIQKIRKQQEDTIAESLHRFVLTLSAYKQAPPNSRH